MSLTLNTQVKLFNYALLLGARLSRPIVGNCKKQKRSKANLAFDLFFFSGKIILAQSDDLFHREF